MIIYLLLFSCNFELSASQENRRSEVAPRSPPYMATTCSNAAHISNITHAPTAPSVYPSPYEQADTE